MVVADIMEKNVITVRGETPVEEVLHLLFNNKISGVPVVNEDGKVVGMVSETDLIQKEKEPRLPSYIEVLGSIIYIEGTKHYQEELRKMVATKVADIMTTQVFTVHEDENVEKVAEIMIEKRVNRIPVVDEKGKIQGIVSRSDMLKPLLS